MTAILTVSCDAAGISVIQETVQDIKSDLTCWPPPLMTGQPLDLRTVCEMPWSYLSLTMTY